MSCVDFARFNTRSDRIRYLGDRFGKYLHGNILDIGCDEGLLRDMLPEGSCYTGIDISGKPDIQLNLEKLESLPFDAGTFDLVLCTDVLEHLDNLHLIFSELVRVSSRYILVSLPNNWANARRPVGRGKGHIGYYGLPVQPPPDRHKWFFSLSEAGEFLEGQADILPFSIIETRITEKPRSPLLRVALRLATRRRESYLNRYAHTLWALLEKKPGTSRS